MFAGLVVPTEQVNALIDKGSVIVALVLAAWILHEAITPAKLIGGGLIVAGLVVIARG